METEIEIKFNTLRTRNTDIIAGMARVETHAEALQSCLQASKEALMNLSNKHYSRISPTPSEQQRRARLSSSRLSSTPSPQNGHQDVPQKLF
eukprot:m.47263 g.47263  ORF g.47263 m.47263 type:complete len:92 (-) comp10472_c0_seq1:51-326(-)